MLEYSIGELKYYYSRYGDGNGSGYEDYTRDDIESINFLEDVLSDAIDSDHINNSVYHIFPSIVVATAAVAVATATILTFA
jgi:hypothetical protein